MDPLSLNLTTQFEVTKYTRIIESTEDLETLRGFAKTLLQAWATQKAATQWVMRDALSAPPRVTPESLYRPKTKDTA
jgi:hypothetical protein